MSVDKQVVRFWQGNKACAEAAIKAGCSFFAGYPITPASEIAEIMSQRLPEVGGIYLQMEDEIGAISAVIGASWGGRLAMTATSGPGFSLMQENIGYAAMTETPCVIVDVQRAGPSTGQATKAAQGDLMQARWGTHGDYESVVLAPNSPQETFWLTIKAFELSERLRHPVILLTDEIIAHSREKVEINANLDLTVKRRFAKKGDLSYGGWASDGWAIMPRFGDGHDLLVTGSTHNEEGFRKTADPVVHNKMVRQMVGKINQESDLLTDVVISGPNEADWGIVSFGSTSRSIEEIMAKNKTNVSIKSLRLKIVWPFPDSEVKSFAQTVEHLLVPELNLGQLSREVAKAVGNATKVVPLNKIGGGLMITPDEILDAIDSA